MSWIDRIISGFLWRRRSLYSDLAEEVRQHIEEKKELLMREGMSGEEAEQAARRAFGNVTLVEEQGREVWQWTRLENLWRDALFALRQIRKSPGFACAVIGTLALGIAAATAMFTVVDQILLRPLPYARASQLVEIYERPVHWNGHDLNFVPFLDIQAWQGRAKSLQQIAFYDWMNGRSFMGSRNSSTEVSLLKVSANFFQVFGIHPRMGPGLPNMLQDFAKSGSEDTVVLSDTAWRSIFHADPHIIGKTVQINGQPYTVTGVMPRGFAFPFGDWIPQAWIPIQLTSKDQVRNEDTPSYSVIARLRPGVKLTTALAEMNTMQGQIAKSYSNPDQRKNATRIKIDPYVSTLVDKSTSRALYALFAAALLLWLIACVNATNLLLARSFARQREMAMRGALGASRWRIAQQLVVESCVMSGAAAALGTAMAVASVHLFQHSFRSHLPFRISASINLPVLGGLVVLTFVSAVLAAAWPAWLAACSPIEPMLRQGGQQSGTSRSHHRLRGGLVIAEIAMSLTLLAACGLMLRTIYDLRRVPLGFRTDHILVANLDIPTYRFSKVNATTELYEPLLERVKHLPGVDAAGLMTDVPLGRTFLMQLSLYQKSSQNIVDAFFKAATPDLKKVYEFRMLAGRYFDVQDTPTSQPVVVVNRAFAREYAPHEQDLNKVVGMQVLKLDPGKQSKQATIIGVMDDFRQRSVDYPPRSEVEVDISQLDPKSGFYTGLEGIAMDLAVRTHRSSDQVVPELREALRQVDPALANAKITTMNQIVEDSYGSQMFAAHLLETFAGSALLLCVAGLYGLLAYVVSQRTREMGVRFALGAQRGDIVWLIMRQAGLLVVVGVAIGLGLAFASTRFIRSYLYGVSAHDVWTMGVVAVVLLLSGAVAAYLPARRAASVDPMQALRSE